MRSAIKHTIRANQAKFYVAKNNLREFVFLASSVNVEFDRSDEANASKYICTPLGMYLQSRVNHVALHVIELHTFSSRVVSSLITCPSCASGCL